MDDELEDPIWVDVMYRYFHDEDTYRGFQERTSSDTAQETIKRPTGPRPMLIDPEGSFHLRALRMKYG